MLMGVITVRVDMFMAVNLFLFATNQLFILYGVQLVTGGGQKIKVMGDDDVSLVQPTQNVYQSFSCYWIKIIARFVEQQQFWLHGKDGGQCHKFFFTPR